MNTYAEVVGYMKEHKCVPEGFAQWDLREEILLRYDAGRTVAHAAVFFNCLPKDFNQWQLADKNGWTVAHQAAALKMLPQNFNQWDLASNYNKTVAHAAADRGNLPEGFNQWHLRDDKGETVFEAACYSSKGLPQWFKDWKLVITDDGETCQEIYERIKKK